MGNLAFFAGGSYADENNSDVVDIYNAETDTWTTTTLSVARGSLAATAVGDMVIFAGGGAAGGYSDVVDIFTIPEPATIGLLAIGGLVMLRRRLAQVLRRKK